MRFIALVLLTTISLHAESADGWGRLKWGATKAQVLRVYATEKARDASGSIVIPEYSIASDSFSVKMDFEEGGLFAVTLYPFDGDAILGLDATSVEIDKALRQGQMAYRIKEMLTQKYGKPGRSTGDTQTATSIDDLWYFNAGTVGIVAGFSSDGKRYAVRL